VVKRKRVRFLNGPKGSGPARGPAKCVVRLGVQLGLRLSRPARQVGYASAKLGSARLGSAPSAGWLPPFVGWAFSSPPPPLFWLGRRFIFRSSRAGGVASFSSLTRRAQASATVGIRCGGARVRCGRRVCVCACVRVRGRPRGARGKVPKAVSRRERDVAFTSRVDAHGGAVARAVAERGSSTARARSGCAHARAVPGCPGPRRGRAVRGAPALRARSTTAAAERRRRLREKKRRDGLLQGKAARRPEGREFLRPLQRVPRLSRQQWGKEKGIRRPRCSPEGPRKGELGAAVRRRRRVGAVRGALQRRRRRSGAPAR
jgi:hypothetical protein